VIIDAYASLEGAMEGIYYHPELSLMIRKATKLLVASALITEDESEAMETAKKLDRDSYFDFQTLRHKVL
jgi:hypothetical protein